MFQSCDTLLLASSILLQMWGKTSKNSSCSSHTCCPTITVYFQDSRTVTLSPGYAYAHLAKPCQHCGCKRVRVVNPGRLDGRNIMECTNRECAATIKFTNIPEGTLISPGGKVCHLYAYSWLLSENHIEQTSEVDRLAHVARSVTWCSDGLLLQLFHWYHHSHSSRFLTGVAKQVVRSMQSGQLYMLYSPASLLRMRFGRARGESRM